MQTQYNGWTKIKEISTSQWEVQCLCGLVFIRDKHHIINNRSKECKICRRAKMTTIKHGLGKSKIFYIWYSMIQRCYRKNVPAFKNYGGRGITVCERWKDFNNFFEDMGHRPHGKSLNRINNNLGYFKENCEWANSSAQNKNKRNVKKYFLEGEQLSIAEIAQKYGIKYNTLYRRITVMGLPIENAITFDKAHQPLR